MSPRSLLRAFPIALLLVLQAGPASAHARYESSNPADKATVSSPPSQVMADFSEPVTSDSYLTVTDPCGEVVSGTSSPSADKVTVSMNGAAAGTYTVYFRVQSTIDSHVTDGTFSFTSSGGSPCPGEEPAPNGGGGDDKNPGGRGGGNDPATGDDGDDSSTGDGSVDTTDSDAPVASDDVATEGDHGGSKNGNRDHSKHKGNGGRNKGNSTDVALPIERARERKAPPPWEGLPADGVITALVIAALIGAAGGRIYASIMGPRA